MTWPRGFSWIEEGRLGGMPQPWSVEDLASLREHGVQVLISLTEEAPMRKWVDEAGILLFHVPIEDMEAPTQEQLDRCMTAIERANAQNMAVAVHCGAGLGRTGTVLAAYLVSKGASAVDAIARVRRLRPGSVETEAQEEAIVEFARRRRKERL